MSDESSPYHNFSPKFPAQHQLRDWMKHIWSNAKVSTLSIPGAHDAGTYSCGKVSCCQFCFSTQCQIWSIYDQLNLGIRYLDIRCQMKNEEPYIRHGFICFQSLNVIFKQVSSFLRQNKSEFVILDFQGDVPNTDCVLNLLNKNEIKYLISQIIPTVGELRGKAWLLGGFGIKFSGAYQLLGIGGIVDEPKYYIQNHFSLGNGMTVKLKVESVIHTAFEVEADPTRLKANFLNMAGEDGVKGFLCGPYPYQFAAMKDGPNAALLHQLQSRPKVHLGLTIMDYPGNELIKAIVRSNDFFNNEVLRRMEQN